MPDGEMPPNGRRLNLRYMGRLKAAAGRIVAHRVYWDQMTFALQVGLAPEPQTAR